MRRTKIVATIGPASRDPDMLARMVDAGLDVARLNFSHGTRELHAENAERVRTASQRAGRPVAILQDLPGPKLRIGALENDVAELKPGETLVLVCGSTEVGNEERMSVSWRGLCEAVDPEDVVYLADGAIRLRVKRVRAETAEIDTQVEIGGAVATRQGLNIPGSTRGLAAVPQEDLDMLRFGESIGVDVVALSFVRTADDVDFVRRHTRLPLIAKIEKPQAVENAIDIIRAADTVMVARGDLGIELPIETVPMVQKDLLRIAGQLARPSITATQMLDSMVVLLAPHPGRGGRRGQCDPRRHRCGDALSGDGGRELPGGGGGHDGLDRRRIPSRHCPTGAGTRSASAAMPATRPTRSPTAPAPPPANSAWPRWSCPRCPAAPPGSSLPTDPTSPSTACLLAGRRCGAAASCGACKQRPCAAMR